MIGKLRRPGMGLLALLAAAGVFSLGYALGGGWGERARGGAGHAAGGAVDEQTTWTCSMHPQIRQPEPGRCPICGMDLIPVTSAGASEPGPRRIRLTPAARALARVQVAAVERMDVETDLRLYGKVLYDETSVDHVTAWFPGRIDRLYVDFTGEQVRRGQALAKLYSPQLLLAQEELIQAARMVENLSKLSAGSAGSSKLQETLEASRERLRLWGMTGKQIAAVESSGTPRKHVTFRSRIEGVVIEKNVFEGTYVDEGTRLFTVANLQSLWVMLDAYESDLASLEKDQAVSFEVEAYPGRRFEGTVSFIDPVIDPLTRTAKVRVEVDNSDEMLKPEMFVTAVVEAELELETAGERPPLVIPASAPLVTGKRAVVYVRAPHDTGLFEGREVTLGPRAGDRYVVHEGLEEGELVVVKGNFKIDSAMQIQAKPSMMSPEGGAAAPGHRHGGPPSSITEPPEQTFDAPGEFLAQLDGAIAAYLDMQDALASDDLEVALGAADRLSETLSATDMELLEGEAHVKWVKMLAAARDALEDADAATGIDEVRASFSHLSEAVILMVRSFGSPGKRVLHLKHCPMAFDDAGADWLQSGAQTRNPYFGSSMLRCAEDVESFGRPDE